MRMMSPLHPHTRPSTVRRCSRVVVGGRQGTAGCEGRGWMVDGERSVKLVEAGKRGKRDEELDERKGREMAG